MRRLDAVVALVDAKHVAARLIDAPEAAAQIVAADLIIVNKVDIASLAETDAAEASIRRLNPFADVRRTTRATLPVADVLGRQAFDLGHTIDLVPRFAEPRSRHAAGVEVVSFLIDRPVQLDRLLRWIDSVVALQGAEVLRVKAILAVEGDDRPFVLQAVNRVMDGDFLGQCGQRFECAPPSRRMRDRRISPGPARRAGNRRDRVEPPQRSATPTGGQEGGRDTP